MRPYLANHYAADGNSTRWIAEGTDGAVTRAVALSDWLLKAATTSNTDTNALFADHGRRKRVRKIAMTGIEQHGSI